MERVTFIGGLASPVSRAAVEAADGGGGFGGCGGGGGGGGGRVPHKEAPRFASAPMPLSFMSRLAQSAAGKGKRGPEPACGCARAARETRQLSAGEAAGAHPPAHPPHSWP